MQHRTQPLAWALRLPSISAGRWRRPPLALAAPPVGAPPHGWRALATRVSRPAAPPAAREVQPASDAPPQVQGTPMMQQYFRFKSDPQFRSSLLLFQMGQFLEAFFDDARTLSQVVGVALTARGYHNGAPIPMAGVPLHAQDAYIAKLVKAGVRVVICEQLDGVSRAGAAAAGTSREGASSRAAEGSSAGGPSVSSEGGSVAPAPPVSSPPTGTSSSPTLMRRAVTRVVTRGTVVDESLLTASAHNYIAAISFLPSSSSSSLHAGLAWADISTGHVFTHAVPLHELASTLASYPPAELLVPVVEGPADLPLLSDASAPAPPLPLELALGKRGRGAVADGDALGPASHSDAATERLLQQLGQLRLQTCGGAAEEERHPLAASPPQQPAARASLVPRLDLPGSEGGDGCAVSFVPCSTFVPAAVHPDSSRFSAAEAQALSGLMAYVKWTQQGALPALRQPFSLREESANDEGTTETLQQPAATSSSLTSPYHFRCLHIDHATRRALEVTRPMNGRRRARGSLLHALDTCDTALGSRLLDMRLCTPLADAAAINHRLDAVDWLRTRPALLESVQTALAGLPDVERCLQRIGLGRGLARDLFAVRDGLHAALRVAALLVTGDHVLWHPLGEAGQAVGAPGADAAALTAGLPSLTAPLAALYGQGSGVTAASDDAALLPQLTQAGLYDFDVSSGAGERSSSGGQPPLPPPVLLQCAAALLLQVGWGQNAAAVAPLAGLYARLCDVLIEAQPRGSVVAPPATTVEEGDVEGGESGAATGSQPSSPPAASAAWIVRPGYSAELDAARALASTAGEELARMQELLRQVTGIPALRLRHTEEMGHTAEVPARWVPSMEAFMKGRRATPPASSSGGEGGWVPTRAIGPASGPEPLTLPPHLAPSRGDPFAFSLAKSLKAGSRYKCPALVRLDTSISEAASRAAALQDAILKQLTQEIAAAAEPLATMCRGAAVVDVTAALADAALTYGLTRPAVLPPTRGSTDAVPVFDVRGGRHLVVERALLEGWSWTTANGAAGERGSSGGGEEEGSTASGEAALAAQLAALAAARAGASSGALASEPAPLRLPVPSTLEGQAKLSKQEWGTDAAGGSPAMPRSFVPNDTVLGGEAAAATAHPTCLVLSGPNMGGKSTYLRQAAHCVILAQSGAFVPAASARLSVVDRLFSRVGASDDVTRDRSTFLVEMEETAAILRGATRDSFVVVDEVGRGTSAVDGLALAWAVLEHLASVTRCRTLFATHMHELAALAVSASSNNSEQPSTSTRLPAMKCAAVAVAARADGGLILSHRIGEHPLQARLKEALGSEASSDAGVWRELVSMSYGVNVAAMAGLPGPVLARAKSVLARLDQSRAAAAWVEAVLAVASTPLEAAPGPRTTPPQ